MKTCKVTQEEMQARSARFMDLGPYLVQHRGARSAS